MSENWAIETGPAGTMIYHYPLGLSEQVSGSQVHIQQMMQGFRETGYAVAPVLGGSDARARAWARLRAEFRRGQRFDFAYAWSPTVPTLMIRRNLLQPWIDVAFFAWCRRHTIPIGLFYGDVHYRLDHFRANIPWRDRSLMQLLFRLDWLVYRRFVDHLFLPSLRMASHLLTSWPTGHATALLPGCRPAGGNRIPAANRDLQLFYVGGVTPPLYDLKAMTDAVAQVPGTCLTLCCREGEWARVKTHYGPLDPARIRIVHASGEGLRPFYETADVFCMFWRHPYLEITMPVKVFEALGNGLPLIAAAGTEAGRFADEAGVGWTPGSTEELRDLLTRLRYEREEVLKKQRRAEAVRHEHTWKVRAQQVASTLIEYSAAPGRSDRCRG